MKTSRIVLLAALALAMSVCVSQAQTLLLRMPFNDTGGGTTAQSDTSTGGANVVLNTLGTNGVAANFQGIPGSGVSGLNVALDFSTNLSLNLGPVADNTASTALNFGTLSAYTATVWFKPNCSGNVTAGSSTITSRIFTLGANGVADKGSANSLGVFYNNTTTINCAFGNGLSLAGSAQPGAFTPGQWYFIAVTYDGATATIYQGTDKGNITQVAQQALTAGQITSATMTLNNASGSVLMVGNRTARNRLFTGWINDLRFYSGAASANSVEDIRWSSLAPIVTAASGNNQVSLTFPNLTGAASYTVYRSTSPAGPFNTSPSGGTGLTSPSFVDSTAVNGTTYYYEVTAVDASGGGTTSAYSQPVAATPVAVPAPPAHVYADVVAGGGGVNVAWTPVLSATFNVLRATSLAGTYTQIATGQSGTSYLDASGVTGDYYEVVSVGAGGNSPASSPVVSVPMLLNVNFASAGVNFNFLNGENPVPSAASGAAVIGSPGDIWNGVNTLGAVAYNTSGPLVNADGSASPVTLGINLAAAGGAFDVNCQGYGLISPFAWTSVANMDNGIGYPNSPYAVLMSSFIDTGASATPNSSVTISNLTPNANYTLFVYSAGNAAGRVSSFWINNGPTNSCTYDNHTTALISGVDFLQFATSADVNGNITINFGTGAAENDLNGFQLIEGIVTAVPASISSSASLNGLTLCTNTSATFTAASASINGVSIGTINAFTNVVATSALGSTVTTTVTNVYRTNGTYASGAVVAGLGSSPATLTIPLSSNLKYSVHITAVPSSGTALLSAMAFDTFAPALVIDTSEYNFGGGSHMETPANGGVWLDYLEGTLAVEGTDFHKSAGEGPAQAIWGGAVIGYRDAGLGTTPPGNAPYVTPANADTFSQQKNALATTGTTVGVNDFPMLAIGYATPGDWWNYTRTFGSSGYPIDSTTSGTYDVYLYLAEGGTGGQQASLSSVPNPATPAASQTLTQLGQFGTGTFAENDWNGFEYVPLTDQYGNIVSVTLSGAKTLQLQLGPGANPNTAFMMLVPAVPVLTPGLSYIYPSSQPFSATNVYNFTVTPNNGANILTGGIDLVLNGVDVSAGLTITPAAGNTWKVSYPLQSNTVYTAVISITNSAAISSQFTYNFDTYNPNYYQWEAVDYDFSTNNNYVTTGTGSPGQTINGLPGWFGGQFIDNPVPTADVNSTTVTGPVGELELNSYFNQPTGFLAANDPFGAGAVALDGVDIHVTGNGQGAGQFLYRVGDNVGNQTAADYLRPKFAAAQTTFNDKNIGLYNVGYIAAGNWFNYTRHYPAGTYNILGRLASGAGAYSLVLGQVTAGVGTTNQTVTPLGTFTSAIGLGWQAWQWIPLQDANNNNVYVTLTGQATTFRATAGSGINMEYFMLVPATAPPAVIAPTNSPGITSFRLVSNGAGGNNVVINGTNGDVGATYYLLTSTNVAKPLNQWQVVATNVVGSGNFTFIGTNAVSPNGVQQFYILSSTNN
jgi:hypothetical protein